MDVGEVMRVERYEDTNLALVTMEIEDDDQPIHNDATIKIRPRLFLEGNFYLDMKPGTPGGRRAGRRRHDPGRPDLDPRPARPGADRAAVGHARPLQRRGQGLRRGAAESEPTPARTRGGG